MGDVRRIRRGAKSGRKSTNRTGTAAFAQTYTISSADQRPREAGNTQRKGMDDGKGLKTW